VSSQLSIAVKILEVRQLKKEDGFVLVQSMVAWCCLRACGGTAHHGGNIWQKLLTL
jgi:hypothetical protein